MNATTTSTPEQVDEFQRLLADVLDVHVHQRNGWQRVRCWNADSHKHGDRTPSMSVNVMTCGYRCHGCGIRGGLSALRRQCGQNAPGNERPSVKAMTARLAALAAPTADVVALLPDDVVTRLRERTGRHKRRHVLNRHLQAMVAAIVTTMQDNDSTRRVRFTATDALRHGIRAETWHDLLDVLPHIGVRVQRGQSGRRLNGARRGRGRGGKLLATTVTLTKSEYSLTAEQVTPYSQHTGVFRNGIHVTLASQVAVRAPLPDDDTPTLSRRTAVARLVYTLSMHETPAEATGTYAAMVKPLRMRLDDLVNLYGRNVRRTVRTAEADGLVRRDRLQADGYVGDEYVTLTELGQSVADRDEIGGTLHLAALAHKAEARMQSFLDRLDEADKRHRCRHELAEWQWPDDARYRRLDDGRLVDVTTGVVHV